MSPAEAQRQARDILAGDRFHEGRHGGGLLHGVFAWIGDRVRDLAHVVPGGGGFRGGDLVALALVVALVAVAVGSFAGRRRARGGGGRARVGAAALAAGSEGPDALERRAAAAERAGDLATAVRLRFQAGLLRLDAARAIELRPSSTSGAVARRLRSERFDALAQTHDAVAYGGRAAEPRDAATAREEWPAVVGEARRR